MELEGEKAVGHMEEYSNAATARGKAMRKAICDKFQFESLEFQSIEGNGRTSRTHMHCLCTVGIQKFNRFFKLCSAYDTVGVNVEMMRCRNGEIFARNDAKTHDLHQIDYVGGVPDSGTPHAMHNRVFYMQNSQTKRNSPHYIYPQVRGACRLCPLRRFNKQRRRAYA